MFSLGASQAKIVNKRLPGTKAKEQLQLFRRLAKAMAERNGEELVISGYEKFNKHRKSNNSCGSWTNCIS